jgi:hypothetical protein
MGDPEGSGLPRRLTTILTWADTFAQDPGGVTDELRAAMIEQFSQQTILECMVYTIIGLNMSKTMIALGVEVGADGTVGHGEGRDIEPYVNSVDEAWVQAKESWEALTHETAKLRDERLARNA